MGFNGKKKNKTLVNSVNLVAGRIHKSKEKNTFAIKNNWVNW